MWSMMSRRKDVVVFNMSHLMTKKNKMACALSAWRKLGSLAIIERTAKTLIRLGGCQGWSESSLGAHSFCWFCHEAAQTEESYEGYETSRNIFEIKSELYTSIKKAMNFRVKRNRYPWEDLHSYTKRKSWWECNQFIWAASSEFGIYRLCEQRRFRRACASAQSRQNLRCSLIQAVSQEEPSDRKPDP